MRGQAPGGGPGPRPGPGRYPGGEEEGQFQEVQCLQKAGELEGSRPQKALTYRLGLSGQVRGPEGSRQYVQRLN